MSERARRFVADELWLLVAVVTLPFGILGEMIADPVSDLVFVLGWFLLTPVFLFWGDEIAALVFSGNGSTSEAAESSTDAVEVLKRRYTEGKIGDEEFERRLERLVALDEAEGTEQLAESDLYRGTDVEIEGAAGETPGDSDRDREIE